MRITKVRVGKDKDKDLVSIQRDAQEDCGLPQY